MGVRSPPERPKFFSGIKKNTIFKYFFFTEVYSYVDPRSHGMSISKEWISIKLDNF